MVFKYLDSVSSLILLTCFIPTRLANLIKTDFICIDQDQPVS